MEAAFKIRNYIIAKQFRVLEMNARFIKETNRVHQRHGIH